VNVERIEFVYNVVSDKMTRRIQISDDVTSGETTPLAATDKSSCMSTNQCVRKHERDWRQIYFARADGNDYGTITYCIDVSKIECSGKCDYLSSFLVFYRIACIAINNSFRKWLRSCESIYR
jgi:hypothetical protein